MRVLIIAPYFAPNPEVAAVRMVSLSSFLAKRGPFVPVLCLSREGLLRENSADELTAKVPDGVETIRFNFNFSTAPLVADYVNGKRFTRVLSGLVDPKDYDVVFNTCGPYYPLEASRLITRWGLPYVLDFRDLGAINYRPAIVRRSAKAATGAKAALKSLYGMLVKRRERAAIKRATRVICISDIDYEVMKSVYDLSAAKLSVATNGFDEARLGSVSPYGDKPYGLTAAVFGKFMYYDKEKASAILEALCDIRARGVDAGLVHIGKCYDWIPGIITTKGIDPTCYTKLGLMEYQVGMARLGSADFFVVEDTSPDDVGTKIYDYIFWNKPVVAVVPPDGPLAELVSGFQNGFVCATNQDVRAAVEKIASEHLDCLDPSLDRSRFSRKHQNQLIEGVLRDAVREVRVR